MANGRIVEVVVNVGGGFAGIGGKSLALPPRALSPDFMDKVLRVNVSKSRFEAGPRFDSSHMKEVTQRAKIAEVIRYYGLEPWFVVDGQKVGENAPILPAISNGLRKYSICQFIQQMGIISAWWRHFSWMCRRGIFIM